MHLFSHSQLVIIPNIFTNSFYAPTDLPIINQLCLVISSCLLWGGHKSRHNLLIGWIVIKFGTYIYSAF